MRQIRKVLSVMICIVMVGLLGMSNIQASGTTITTTIPKQHSLLMQVSDGGSVKINGKTVKDKETITVERLKDTMIQIKAKKGYQLDKLLIAGEERKSEMDEDVFVMKAVNADHEIHVTFVKAGVIEETTPEEVSNDIKKLPDVEDFDKLTPEEKEEVKEQVNGIAENIETMDKEKQKEIKQEDVIKVAKLYDKIYHVKIIKDTTAAQGLPTHIDEKDIKIIGAGMAAKALGGDVKVIVTQDIPTKGSLAFTMKLMVKREGEKDYQQVQLATPIVFQIKLPEHIKVKRLKVNHYRDNGELIEVLKPEINGEVASVLTASFSTFEFIEEQEKQEEPKQEDEKKDTAIVDTADHHHVASLMAMCVIAGICMYSIKRKKLK